MLRKSTLALACTAATFVGLASAPAQAATFSLGDLIKNNSTITIGDKAFSDFSCTLSRGGAGITTPFNCDQINVTTTTVGGNYALEFQSGFFSTGGTFLDALLGYTVKVLDPTMWINNIGLSFNGVTTGDGFTNVAETVANSGGTTIGAATVTAPTPLSTLISLNEPVKEAKVKKDIFLTGGSSGTASISVIDQWFVQKKVEVPEPGTVSGALAIGAFGVGMMLKKRRSQSDALAFLPVNNDAENN